MNRFQWSLFPSSARRAFGRSDLIALLAGSALLILLQSMAGGASKSSSGVARCQDNLRQLTAAWALYADDNLQYLPGNLDGAMSMMWRNTNQGWVLGWMENREFTHWNTNLQALTEAQLGPYGPGPAVYRCPADPSLSHGTNGVPRVRSLAMNGALGRPHPWTAGYRTYLKASELSGLAPEELFVLIEEREESINDGCFWVDMLGFDPPSSRAHRIVDFPADWHDAAGHLSFADGHVELWTWTDERTRPPHRPGGQIPLNVSSPDNPDVRRIQAVSTGRVR